MKFHLIEEPSSPDFSPLRYRVQAPMIDSLMKEIGIEGSGLGRMTEVLRDAKDIEALL